MNNTERILAIASDNNGTVTTAQVTHAGISREYLRILVDKGLLEKSARGVYIVPSVFDDEMFNLQSRFKRGVFSHETALFLLDLTDRTPVKYTMTFPLGYNVGALATEKVRCHRVKDDLYEIGIMSTKSPGGNMVRLYNSERTLCDILKGRSGTEIQIISDAFKRYARHERRNIPLLSQYAKLMRVEKKLRPYLEVLL